MVDNLEHVWYANIIFFLKKLTFTNHLVSKKIRSLRLQASKYCLVQDGLGWRDLKGLILKCIDEKELKRIMSKFHVGFCGGDYTDKTKTHKILKAGYLWLSIFINVHK